MTLHKASVTGVNHVLLKKPEKNVNVGKIIGNINQP
jgi:hypothetical protein